MKRLTLLFLIVISASSFAAIAAEAAPPVAGKDYIEIPEGRPLVPEDGKIVVEEFFNYICPACNRFEPQFAAWRKALPSYVNVELVPAAFRPDFEVYARAYYAADAHGLVEQTHEAVYDAIHVKHTLPAEGDKPDEQNIAEFYAQYGVDAEAFLETMSGFSVTLKVRQASQHARSLRIPGTPSILVNGRYLVKGTTYADMLQTASYLIEKEHGE